LGQPEDRSGEGVQDLVAQHLIAERLTDPGLTAGAPLVAGIRESIDRLCASASQSSVSERS
jgi:hypothetical protein